MNKRLLLVASAVTALAVAAGCGGGGSSALTPSQGHGGTMAPATAIIKIPPKASTSSAKSRSPQYISPDTGSVSFAVNGGAAQVVALGPSSTGCAGSTSAGYVCTASFQAPVGTGQSVVIKTYQSTGATGTALSQVTQTFDVTSAGPNAITFTLGGVIASFKAVLNPTSITSGTASSGTLTWTALDAAGDTIIGPGALVNAGGTALPDPPTVAAAPAITGLAIGAYTPNKASDNSVIGGSWAVTYDGTTTSETSTTFTVSSSGVTSGTAPMTVSGAAPTPSPTASPTGAPVNAIVNGDFETSSTSFAPWYTCYVQHHQVALTDDNPDDSAQGAYAVPTAGPDTAPTTAPNANDATVQQSVQMTGGADQPVHGGGNAALVGMGLGMTTANTGKGALGICQNVVVPASGQLSLWVLEGGNKAYYDGQDQEAEIFLASAGLNSSTNTTASLPDLQLFSENNCWNGLNLQGGSGPNGATKPCAIDHSGVPDLANGNVWREKGPYDLSTYAGQTVTVFLGIWNSSSSGTYYNYAYYDDVQLTGAAGPTPSPAPTASIGITISGGTHR